MGVSAALIRTAAAISCQAESSFEFISHRRFGSSNLAHQLFKNVDSLPFCFITAHKCCDIVPSLQLCLIDAATTAQPFHIVHSCNRLFLVCSIRFLPFAVGMKPGGPSAGLTEEAMNAAFILEDRRDITAEQFEEANQMWLNGVRLTQTVREADENFVLSAITKDTAPLVPMDMRQDAPDSIIITTQTTAPDTGDDLIRGIVKRLEQVAISLDRDGKKDIALQIKSEAQTLFTPQAYRDRDNRTHDNEHKELVREMRQYMSHFRTIDINDLTKLITRTNTKNEGRIID
ncbi:hypothetical protein NM208_g11431 [Fusarium decemcellulare]|uniref:Uncharacterized protein n=1 Tax=Fusarium decemcellulare TaxID=57161 RepID=A0ACC1RTM8_9HYPO|nr:hypothetical protein NM208_g11431 [Fusarium decemcellulare]